MERLAHVRWPRSYRGRIALVIAVALAAVTVGVQGAVRGVVDERVRSAAERTLREQAQAIADAVAATPDAGKGDRAADAARFLPDTRIVVTWSAPPGLYYNIVPGEQLDAEATARAGSVEVRLERESRAGGVATWLVVALFAGGLAVTAGLIWALATALARRLRRQAADLAGTAEAVASGDLTVRVIETEDELGRAAKAFNVMANRLAEADERQRRFLADVAHELRTPVTAIDGFASALTDGAAHDAESREEAAHFIRQEAARLRELIADLRTLTRLDLAPPLRIGPVDLARIARETIARFGPDAAAAGVTIRAAEGSLPVRTDGEQVKLVLANLVANAITATPPGGRVDVDVDGDGAVARLVVSDTGIGIPPADLPRIFDRLYRVDASRSRDAGGSGLGLAIVKRVTELLGGDVDVKSTPGEGSVFTVALPIDVERTAGSERAPDAPPTASGLVERTFRPT